MSMRPPSWGSRCRGVAASLSGVMLLIRVSSVPRNGSSVSRHGESSFDFFPPCFPTWQPVDVGFPTNFQIFSHTSKPLLGHCDFLSLPSSFSLSSLLLSSFSSFLFLFILFYYFSSPFPSFFQIFRSISGFLNVTSFSPSSISLFIYQSRHFLDNILD